MADEDGNRIAELNTDKYGEVYHKHILFDGRASHISTTNWEPLSQVTHILLVPGVFFPEDVLGAVLRATNSETAATAVVTDVDPNGAYIQFDDPNGAVADIVSNDDGQFLIFDNRMAAYTGYPTTGGTWTGVEAVDDPEFGMRTILNAGGEDFAEFMVGWQVQIDAAVPVYLDIVAVDGELLIVSGDVSALVTAEETEFCIIHPVGVNPQNGATQTNPCRPESRYLWGGGYYLPPIAGFEMDHEGNYGIHGQQPGQNKSGQHYMWNRVYDISIGRWTTPDPALVSWANSFDFVSNDPIQRTDPSGLDDRIDAAEGRSRCVETYHNALKAYQHGVEAGYMKPDPAYIQALAKAFHSCYQRFGRTATAVTGEPDEVKAAKYYSDKNAGVNAIEVRERDSIARKIDGGRGCISKLFLVGHANEDGVAIGNSASVGPRDFAGIKFCKPCVIILFGCNVGLGKSGQAIADKTKCDVYAPMNFCDAEGVGDDPDADDGTVKGKKDSDYIKDTTDPRFKNRAGRSNKYHKWTPAK